VRDGGGERKNVLSEARGVVGVLHACSDISRHSSLEHADTTSVIRAGIEERGERSVQDDAREEEDLKQFEPNTRDNLVQRRTCYIMFMRVVTARQGADVDQHMLLLATAPRRTLSQCQ